MRILLKTGRNQPFLRASLPTSLFGVFVIRLGFDIWFELFLLIAHVHPPVPHYLLLGKKTFGFRKEGGGKKASGFESRCNRRTSRLPLLEGFRMRNFLSRFSQSVDM